MEATKAPALNDGLIFVLFLNNCGFGFCFVFVHNSLYISHFLFLLLFIYIYEFFLFSFNMVLELRSGSCCPVAVSALVRPYGYVTCDLSPSCGDLH